MLRVILGFASLGFLLACGGVAADVTSEPSPAATSSQASPPPADPSPPPPPAPASNGPDCKYANVIGTATITSIEQPGDLDYACSNDGVVARFSFTPDDASAPSVPTSLQNVDEGNRRIMQGSKLAARGCLKELGLDVGSAFRVERLMETSGTCTPVIYIPQIDVDACKTPCDP